MGYRSDTLICRNFSLLISLLGYDVLFLKMYQSLVLNRNFELMLFKFNKTNAYSDTVFTCQVSSVQLMTDNKLKAFNKA